MLFFALLSRVSLVVTETFDAALFGEGVLSALSHAWRELLVPSPEGSVIPRGASLWIAPIECADISRRYILQNPHKSEHLLKMPPLNVSAEMTDPYDTENLLRVPGGFRLLAEPVKAFTVDFNSREDVEAHLNKETEISISCNASGRFDAVAVWFDLTMDDIDVLTTRPIEGNHQRASCWEQAVFPQSSLRTVDEGSSLKLSVSNKDSRVEIRVLNEEEEDKLVVPQDVVCFLNNFSWVEEFCKTADELFEMWEDLKSGTLELMDLCPFPVLGLRFLSRCGKKSRWKMTCLELSADHARLVKAVAAENGIPDSRIHFIKEDGLPERMFHLIVWNFFDPKGELDEKAIAQYPEIK